MIKFFLSLLLLTAGLEVCGSGVADVYIERYKDIAIAEMGRTGIPASIKLAQGLLESDWGRSDLARTANNHFGIKCGGLWEGEGYYLEDDDTDHKGNLVPSCFRVFKSANESYMAHSEFLTSEDRTGRYAFLFKYELTDYKSWAKGLKKAGYATDKKYSSKLIAIIEKYELYIYDEMVIPDYESPLITQGQTIGEIEKGVSKKSRLKSSATISKSYKAGNYTFSTINNVRTTTALGGETLAELAARTGSDIEELMEYNEGYGYRTIIMNKGDIVYFSKKKRSFKGDLEYHVYKDGETMFLVSQMYGIKMDNLYAKNKMPKGSEPLSGSRLYLKKTAPNGDRPAYTKHPARDEEVEFLFAADDAVK